MSSYSADRLIQLVISLTAQKDLSLLLDSILAEAMSVTRCDGGTVYIREGDQLNFHNVVTLSKGVHMIRRGEEHILPPVPISRDHVCACAALDHRLTNIPDAYEVTRYNLAGTRRYDALNNYRTKSMLVVPMEDERGRCIGVMQLINAQDERGEVVSFGSEHEKIVAALGTLAAISLNNNLLQQAVYDILHSFVKVMVNAVDARSPYNANHTRSMVHYAQRFVEWLGAGDHGWRFAEDEKDPFLMSVWLHDIGKLVIPLEIMDKPTRLGKLEGPLLSRIEVAVLMEKLRAFEHPEQAEAARLHGQALEEARQTILAASSAPFLPDEMCQKLRQIGEMRCLRADGQEIPLLTEEEREALSVRRGTLTAGERHAIEMHVVHTRQLLGGMKFSGIYTPVPAWASAHHEFLNGSGYPDHLRAEDLPRPVRLLTILDIYDALTAEDRPYKPPMPPERAFSILESMRDEGKLDGELLAQFRESEAWKKPVRPSAAR